MQLPDNYYADCFRQTLGTIFFKQQIANIIPAKAETSSLTDYHVIDLDCENLAFILSQINAANEYWKSLINH